ncbi:MAG TPA: WhiB family transcriptional regulator [Mycobacteriales bacterium]|nr:WhiB family transcriptional regulator [Mycobacteriales bacterium]
MRKVILTPDLLRRVYGDARFRAALDAETGRDWREAGSCVGADDPDVFFPVDNDQLAPARALCRRCPVAGPCLAEALGRAEIDGVWGGTTTAERRSMRAVWRHHHRTVAAVAS